MPSSSSNACSTADGSDTPTQHTRYKDDDADITLISSDNVAFQVHSYRLQSASSVFRAMITTPSTSSRQSINLTDRRFETSRVVENILDITYLYKDTSRLSLKLLLEIVDFADKYDMVLVRNHIFVHAGRGPLGITDSKDYRLSSFTVLLRLAWKLKDKKTLKSTLAVAPRIDTELLSSRGVIKVTTGLDRYAYDTPMTAWSDEGTTDLSDFGLENLPYSIHVLIPPNLTYIMHQAERAGYRARGISGDDVDFILAYKDEARRLLDLALPDDKAEASAKPRLQRVKKRAKR